MTPIDEVKLKYPTASDMKAQAILDALNDDTRFLVRGFPIDWEYLEPHTVKKINEIMRHF